LTGISRQGHESVGGTVRDLFEDAKRVDQPGHSLKAIGFGMGDRIAEFQRGSRVRIAFTPKVSTFRGHAEVELELKDIRP
jgi:hypothetical protein